MEEGAGVPSAGDAGDTPNKREKRATMRNGDGELPVSSIMLRG